jgi:hypothetical protein
VLPFLNIPGAFGSAAIDDEDLQFLGVMVKLGDL